VIVTFTVRPFEDADFEETANFLPDVFGVGRLFAAENFTHWWHQNPSWSPDIFRGWVARSTGGQLIGFMANIPLPYMIDRTRSVCCAASSLVVHPEWRGHGVARAIGQAFLDQGSVGLLVGTESTEPAYRLWRSLGMLSLDRPWQTTAYRVLADGKGWIAGRAGALAGACADLVQRSLTALSRPSSAIRVERIERFEASDASGLERSSASTSTTFPLRDVDSANWLFFGSDRIRRTRVVLAARSGSELIGYLAMKRRGAIAYYLLECRTLAADPEIARQLLWAARVYAQEQKIAYLIVRPYAPLVSVALPPLLSWRSDQGVVTFCYQAKHDFNVNDWETSPVDGDVGVN